MAVDFMVIAKKMTIYKSGIYERVLPALSLQSLLTFT